MSERDGDQRCERAEPPRAAPLHADGAGARAPGLRSRAARVTANLVAFALALVATCLGIRALLATAPGIQFNPNTIEGVKTGELRRRSDEISAVFVGSSRFYRSLDPRVFDGELAARGYPVRSYNYGQAAMWFPEVLFTVGDVLAMDLPNLKWLVVELGNVRVDMEPGNFFKQRPNRWHTPASVAVVLEEITRSGEPRPEKAALARLHLHHGLYNLANIGTALPALRTLCGLRRAPSGYPNLDGYLALDRDGSALEKRVQRHEEFLSRPEELQQRQRELIRPPPRVELDPLLRRHLTELVGRAEAVGVVPLFVVPPPSEVRHPELTAARAEGVLPNLFAYDDPARHPELYDVENMFDLEHLNARGAELFTRQLATEVAQYLDGLERTGR